MIPATSPAYVWIIIGMGIGAIIWCFVPGVKFHPGMFGSRNENRKEIPRWFGRIWFIGFGLWLIYMGIHATHWITF
jgi:hypothetical protein